VRKLSRPGLRTPQVSSQLKNPITPAGRALDIALELWAIIVVAGAAGAIAAFFQNADSQ
jgi:hypothetical protein